MCDYCRGWGTQLGPKEPCKHCGRYACQSCNGHGSSLNDCLICKGLGVLRVQPKIIRVVCKKRARKLIKRGIEVKLSITGHLYWIKPQ